MPKQPLAQQQRTPAIDSATLRQLAVTASCDPRTILAVAEGRSVKGLAGDRARKVLIEAGYTIPFDTLNEIDREYLKALIDEQGLNAAARALGISRGVVSSAVGGIEVRRGSIEMLREALTTYRKAATK